MTGISRGVFRLYRNVKLLNLKLQYFCPSWDKALANIRRGVSRGTTLDKKQIPEPQ